ncbi:MAG: hypothetical protein LYZ69_07065 [Nitrososphaerales archaeon]|nr:hypothetical protein [Nitrososphaerales archaeon]
MDPLVVAVLAWFHILFAILWFGGSSFFGFVLAPFLGRLSVGAQREFYLNFGRRTNAFFRAVSGLTILFGFLLLYSFTNGNLSDLWTTAWGSKRSIGLSLGLVAFLLVNLLTAPHFDRAISILRLTQPSDHQTLPAEFQKELRVGGISAGLTGGVLFLTLVFMVGSAFY